MASSSSSSSSSPTLNTISLPEPGNPSSVALSTEIYIPPNPKSRNRSAFLLLPFWGGTARTYSIVQHGLVRECPRNASIAVSYKGTGKAWGGDSTSSSAAAAVADNDPARHSIKMLAEDVLRFLQSPQLAQIGVDVSNLIICAHSMSAKVALRLASMIPQSERLGLRSLLLLSPAPPLPLTLPPEVRSGQLTAYDSVKNAKWTIENVLTAVKMDDQTVMLLVEDCVGMSRGARRGWIEIGMAESLAAVVGMGDDDDDDDSCEKMRTVPVRVLAGARDKVETFERVESETVATLRAGGFEVTLMKLEGCGHLIPVEVPDVVVKELCSLAQET